MELIATEIVQSLDSFRALFLRTTLRLDFLRRLYRRSHYRLAVGMLLSTLFYLPLALLRPELLLAFGPLIFGYPHLISSFRFTSKFHRFHLFFFASLVAIGLHLFHSGFPFGAWQMIIATLVFFMTGPTWKRAALAFSFCAISLKLAWMEPIVYTGGMLLAHNFIAFIYWIKSARTSARRRTAILSTIFFTLLHVVTCMGFLDPWLSLAENKTSWLLSSWSTDPMVGHRMLFLYAFGLSLHYFVWLRAIPETLSKFEHPHSIRLILNNLKLSLGQKTLIVSLLFAAAMMILWMISLPLGAQIYFELAILHGALEMVFLLE